jgi:hypothetical protein
MNFEGLIIGFAAFLLTGLFHPIIIKCDYYFTDKPWPLFLIAGVAATAASCFLQQTVVSAILAIFGWTCFWSIIELRKQRKRVKMGWFPENPVRAARPDAGKKESQ